MKDKLISFLSVFTSSSTLICCALPALVAAIAGGTAVSSLVSTFPWLVPLSKYKLWIFLIAWILIVISGFLTFKPIQTQCDPNKGQTGCDTTSRFSRVTFFVSLGILSFATFFSYALTPILRWIDQLRGL